MAKKVKKQRADEAPAFQIDKDLYYKTAEDVLNRAVCSAALRMRGIDPSNMEQIEATRIMLSSFPDVGEKAHTALREVIDRACEHAVEQAIARIMKGEGVDSIAVEAALGGSDE